MRKYIIEDDDSERACDAKISSLAVSVLSSLYLILVPFTDMYGRYILRYHE